MHECTFPVWAAILIVEVVFSVIAGWLSFYVPKTPQGKITTHRNEDKLVIHAKGIVEPPVALAVLSVLTISVAISFLVWFLPTIESHTWLQVAVYVFSIILILVVALIIEVVLFCAYAGIMFIKVYFKEKHFAFIYNEDPDCVEIIF